MTIGICQIRQVVINQFEYWGWYNTGHGHYCVDSNGLVTHSDIIGNWRYKSFEFKKGDMLHFDYSPIQEKLSVTNDNHLYCEIDIVKGIEENYAFCAYLNNTGD